MHKIHRLVIPGTQGRSDRSIQEREGRVASWWLLWVCARRQPSASLKLASAVTFFLVSIFFVHIPTSGSPVVPFVRRVSMVNVVKEAFSQQLRNNYQTIHDILFEIPDSRQSQNKSQWLGEPRCKTDIDHEYSTWYHVTKIPCATVNEWKYVGVFNINDASSKSFQNKIYYSYLKEGSTDQQNCLGWIGNLEGQRLGWSAYKIEEFETDRMCATNLTTRRLWWSSLNGHRWWRGL